MPYPRTPHEHAILSDHCGGQVTKSELARRYCVDRKTIHAVLVRYGVQESEASKLGRMKKDTEGLARVMLRFINRSPPTPELVPYRQQLMQALGEYEAKWLA